MTKLSRQNVGGIDYTMVGCTLTGVCASAASDYVKAVTLSDGDILADGMSVVITFANGNTAGTAPASLTIYSSDQVNYYSDSGLTQPFTLAPSGCYDIEYTGTGNAYTYTSYPVIQVEGVTAPLCDSCGKKTSGAVWDAGDAVLMLYSGGKFMAISGLTNVVTAGSKKAVTSGAVASATSQFSNWSKKSVLYSAGSTDKYVKIISAPTVSVTRYVNMLANRVDETIDIQSLSQKWRSGIIRSKLFRHSRAFTVEGGVTPERIYSSYLIEDSNHDLWVHVASYSSVVIELWGSGDEDIVGVVGTPQANYIIDGYMHKDDRLLNDATENSQLGITSGGVYEDSFLLREGGNSDIDNYPIDGIRAYRVTGKNIGWVSNDGIVINLPWSNTNFGAQIAIDDQSNWLAIRTKSQGVWSSWDRLVKSSEIDAENNDNDLVDITSQLTMSLGVNDVSAYKKNNMVYLRIQGNYTDNQTATTHRLIEGLPQKYRPKVQQFAVGLAYNTVPPNVYPARLVVYPTGNIYMSESGFPNNAVMRIGILYMTN